MNGNRWENNSNSIEDIKKLIENDKKYIYKNNPLIIIDKKTYDYIKIKTLTNKGK